MNNEYQPRFEKDLAVAATPEEFDGEKVETTNDPASSLEKGLVTLYDKYLARIDRQREAGLIDREKADDLADKILALAKRDGLRNEVRYTSTERAQEIMGAESYFGPQEVSEAGIEIKEEIPPIPFSLSELERAKELGQMLIYRTSTTMKELNGTFSPKLQADNKGSVLRDTAWYEEDDFYTSKKIQPCWALVSKEPNPGSTKKNYLEQSVFLAEYLVNEVFRGKPLPPEYQEAIDEFNAQELSIRALVSNDERTRANKIVINLKINQLSRQSPAEVIYDCLVYFQNTGGRLHGSGYVWTSSQEESGPYQIIVGQADHRGAIVKNIWVGHPNPSIGVSFCRRGADLKS